MLHERLVNAVRKTGAVVTQIGEHWYTATKGDITVEWRVQSNNKETWTVFGLQSENPRLPFDTIKQAVRNLNGLNPYM